MTLSAYAIPPSLASEIDELESLITGFLSGSITENELKAHRVPFGVYEQRKKGTFMMRIRCTAGIITPLQLRRVAELSLRFASGSLHITTRQEIQIHDVAIKDLISVIRGLAAVGLSTRGGGGNTVRNITASWDSGVAHDEIFDVTPYAIALTSALIARGDSWLLPRKYKIAFSNSSKDTAFATVNDLGFVARIKDGTHGFRVFVAGGMGRQSQPGSLLHDFVPASEIFLIAEAVKRLFSNHGNRKNKHAARLRFLWNTLGRERFIALYIEEKTKLLDENIPNPRVNPIANEAALPSGAQPAAETSESFVTWQKRHVGVQKQPGANTVSIPLLFGIISAEKALLLADFLVPFGDNTIRFTLDQNIALRNIPPDFLGNIYDIVRKISDLSSRAPILGKAVACAGAATCQLGICRSRGALEAITDRLKKSSVDLDTVSDVRLHVSGCSNTCGQHMIADIGVFGKAGRKDQHSYPVYAIVGGATIDMNGYWHLAQKIDEINARDLPECIEEIMHHYSERKSAYPDFHSYLQAEGKDLIRKSCNRFKEIPPFDVDNSYYRDWGGVESFSLAGKGTGECSAGLFDLIEIDLSKLREMRSAVLEKGVGGSSPQELFDLSLVSARMLLITRGVEASSDTDVFDKFAELFIAQNLVESRFAAVVDKGRSGSSGDLIPMRGEVLALSNAVELLYLGMDNSLQFGITNETTPSVVPDKNQPPDLVKDFRGVGCPMNFVKTKMALSLLSKTQVLEIALDDGAPIENVPRSLIDEGHAILEQRKENDHWIVRVQKGN